MDVQRIKGVIVAAAANVPPTVCEPEAQLAEARRMTTSLPGLLLGVLRVGGLARMHRRAPDA